MRSVTLICTARLVELIVGQLSTLAFDNVNEHPEYVAQLPNGDNAKGVAALRGVTSMAVESHEFGENFEDIVD
ncbi:hypothetical protein GN244_ATG00741 [Phytophthora infestans]|uniref:Secreted RxLR effector peptide protein n=1 Tax=Phytophthora infestans TaxID=4787 RepID=A0A833T4J8_PHYIN|nr:hypothetical protein GN244_ATG00741 [Phytophthora infestans]KAF4143131.1 hypothetical protein GN958_ATG07661 [Phytophthora infestans]